MCLCWATFAVSTGVHLRSIISEFMSLIYRRQERYYSITHLSRNDMIYKFALVVTIVVVSQLPYPQSAIAPDR